MLLAYYFAPQQKYVQQRCEFLTSFLSLAFFAASTLLLPPFNVSTPHQRLISLPPTYKNDWKTATRFPVGSEFIGGVIDNQIILWGGNQIQEDGRGYFLPTNVVYSFTPSQSGNAEGGWKRMPATGDVHPARTGAASATINGKIYLYGGSGTNSRLIAPLFTLSWK